MENDVLEGKGTGGHRLSLFVAGIIVVVLGTLVLTRPSRDDHKEAIMKEVKSAVNKSMNSATDDEFSMVIGFFSSALVSGISGYALDNILQLEDYFLFNRGVLEWDGEKRTVSYGVLGHVFTISDDEIVEKLNDL